MHKHEHHCPVTHHPKTLGYSEDTRVDIVTWMRHEIQDLPYVLLVRRSSSRCVIFPLVTFIFSTQLLVTFIIPMLVWSLITLIVMPNYFQDRWLSIQTKTRLFSVFCFQPHASWVTFKKITHLIILPSQICSIV